MTKPLIFQDPSDLSDLNSFLNRAKKLDSEGAVKLRTFGDVLAVYVAPMFSASLLGDGPTILGLRTLKLGELGEIDGTFEISSILERIASPSAQISLSIEIPPAQVRVAWSGVLPPREGWKRIGELSQEQLTQWAKEGIAEVATALPESVGSSIANKVRLQIWGRTVESNFDLPGGAAFAMAGLGFMQPGEKIPVFQSQNWLRLSSSHGHVLTRKSSRL